MKKWFLVLATVFITFQASAKESLKNEKEIFQQTLQDFGNILHSFECTTYVNRLGEVAMFPTFETENFRDKSFKVKFGLFTVGYGNKTVAMRVYLNGSRSGDFEVHQNEQMQLLSYTKNGETLSLSMIGEKLYGLSYEKQARNSKFQCIRMIE